MPCIHDEEAIQALGAHGPNKTLGIRVSVQGPQWGSQDLYTFRPKNLVETGHVLGVAIADEELGRDSLIGNVTGHVPGLLGGPRRLGVASDPDPSSAYLDEEQNLEI